MSFNPFDVAGQIADCICAQLTDPARGEDVWAGDCCVVAGAGAAWDNCCEGLGTAYIALLSGYPTNSFPASLGMPSPCTGLGGPNQAATFEIGVMRCVCTMLEDGSPCLCETKERDAARVMGDLNAVLVGLNCCFADALEGRDECSRWMLNSWRSVGPMGGCAGIIVSVTIELDSPCCPTV